LDDIQGKPLDTPSTIQPKAKGLLPRLEPFVDKEFLAKGVSWRKVELDKIVNPSLEIPSSVTKSLLNAPSI
jgi:hypothetical protein